MDGDASHSNATNPPNPPSPSNQATINPPSIEAAYKRKCIELKKRLIEVESNNDSMHLRNERGRRYIQKMRLESCLLLERLALLSGMSDESGPNTELRSRAMGLMKESGSLLDEGEPGPADAPSGSKRLPDEEDYLDDESAGSFEEKPPTPEERPLRGKKNRKDDANTTNNGPNDMNASTVSTTFSDFSHVRPQPRPASYDPRCSACVFQQPHQHYYPHPMMNQIQPVTFPHDPRFGPPAFGGPFWQPHPDSQQWKNFADERRSQITQRLIQTHGIENVREGDVERIFIQEWEESIGIYRGPAHLPN